jgi:hypothetical protein
MVQRATQQSLVGTLGEHRALRACAPACFYMVAQAAGYVPDDVSLADFCARLDWGPAFSPERGWVRPALARQLREQYGAAIVSWQLGGNRDDSPDTIDRMAAAGYLATEREINVYGAEVAGRDVAEVVRAGYPVIAGMKAGFAANQQSHAVILLEWKDAEVTVIDPDDRNSQRQYPESIVREYLNPTGGGCTIILPR